MKQPIKPKKPTFWGQEPNRFMAGKTGELTIEHDSGICTCTPYTNDQIEASLSKEVFELISSAIAKLPQTVFDYDIDITHGKVKITYSFAEPNANQCQLWYLDL